jgi:Cytochrome P450
LPMPEEWYEGWYDAAAHNAAVKAEAGGSGDDAAVDPDDVAAEKGRAKRYIPFAEGPRNCVGQSLAKVSLVATLASLLPKFKFELDASMGGATGVRAREQYTLVTGIENGMWMKAVKRDTNVAY